MMSKVRVEIRADGLYCIQDVFGKPLERKVERGWHILFVDEHGLQRLGFVCSISAEKRLVAVMDDVVYRNAPSPIGEPQEVIAFSQVLEAGGGFYRPRRKVETSTRVTLREVWVIDESNSEVGFVVGKNGLRFYVEKRDGKWEVR